MLFSKCFQLMWKPFRQWEPTVDEHKSLLDHSRHFLNLLGFPHLCITAEPVPGPGGLRRHQGAPCQPSSNDCALEKPHHCPTQDRGHNPAPLALWPGALWGPSDTWMLLLPNIPALSSGVGERCSVLLERKLFHLQLTGALEAILLTFSSSASQSYNKQLFANKISPPS